MLHLYKVLSELFNINLKSGKNETASYYGSQNETARSHKGKVQSLKQDPLRSCFKYWTLALLVTAVSYFGPTILGVSFGL